MGIFRLSANARTVKDLMTACVGLYERKVSEDAMVRLFAPYEDEVDVAASVLKAYLREQSQPLIPTSFHDRFVAVPGAFLPVLCSDRGTYLTFPAFVVAVICVSVRLCVHRHGQAG